MAGNQKGKAPAKAAGKPAPAKAAPAVEAAPVVEAVPVAEAAPVVESSVGYAAPMAGTEAAADAPSIAADAIPVTHLQVSARKEGFRRAGRAWTVAATRVAIDEFTADQVEQLYNEPKLTVVAVSDVAVQS